MEQIEAKDASKARPASQSQFIDLVFINNFLFDFEKFFLNHSQLNMLVYVLIQKLRGLVIVIHDCCSMTD